MSASGIDNIPTGERNKDEHIGLIAGSGQFPLLFAQAARRSGVRVVAVGFQGETTPELAGMVDEFHMLKLGQLNRLIKAFRNAGVSRAAMAGAINKTRIYSRIRPDWRAIKLIHRLRRKNDDFLLRAIAEELESEGILIEPSTLFVPSLLAPEGVLTRRKPNQRERLDIEFGWEMAKGMGHLDIGQCLVVKDQSVLAVEGIDGTDATILRGGALCDKGAVVIKVCKPNQDLRFDIPAVGLATIETMKQVHASVLVFEADKSLMFDRDRMIDMANAAGVSLVSRRSEDAASGAGGHALRGAPESIEARPLKAETAPSWAASPFLVREPVAGALRVAVIGVGHLGRFHAQKYAAIPEADLVAVVDLDEHRGDSMAQSIHAAAIRNYRELIGRVDAVSIVTPTQSHYAIAKDFLSAGVHVLLEKPMTRTIEEADELIAIAKERGCVLQVGHLERFNPAFQAILPYVKTPLFLEAHRLAPFKERGIEVDVVLDLMIHDIDAALALMKSPLERIWAAGVPVLTQLPDIANVRLEFANGTMANLTASRISVKSMRRLRLFQENCYLVADCQNKRAYSFWKEEESDESGYPQVSTEEIEVVEMDALEQEILSFMECIRSGGAPVVDGEQGRRALAIALDISRQIEEQSRRNGFKQSE